MSNDAILKTTCPQCHNSLVFPREAMGDTAPCPRCGNEVVLTTVQRTRARILIDPKGQAIPVQSCGTASALTVVALLEFIGAALVLLNFNVSWALGLAVSAIFTLALAKLVQSAHESTARLARMELFFQQAANERR